MYSVFGLGNLLLDFITSADFTLIDRLKTRKGTMNLVNREGMEEILDIVKGYKNIPGGSCANTMRGIAWLSVFNPVPPPICCGAVGDDFIGRQYKEILQQSGVEARIVVKESLSGCSVILVTPDRERTMFTYLGACREYVEDDLDLKALKHSQVFHTTGYMWDTENQKKAVQKAIHCAEAENIIISFDLADPFVVGRYRQEFLSWIPSKVNILFGNREEYTILFPEEQSDNKLIHCAGKFADTAVMKIGAEGCLVNRQGKIDLCSGYPVKSIDTTAAGDTFAAGFLYGRIKGFSAVLSAGIANRLAAQIVTVEGCDFSQLDQQLVVVEED